ncbi:prolyl aminopeptidase [Thioclava sp. A2]|uniref:prolyl aminopeptidase n=1 Tax=Thioclava sp. FCG-A2 TaxID=3080562 RepID=UPI002953FA01|nr:prolyl aminopeptidase [Thioclava sp. A2]MDV7272321.1 prolyl aminopeptidase [Thioclava sp. A2]
MDRTAGQKRTPEAFLYPPLDPFERRMMTTPDGQQIYVEQSGHPSGQPVVVCHGGPGGGCSPAMRRFFDPDHYRIILFDQRGCGLSRPHAGVENNTTAHLLADMEQIRESLGIDRWIVFGGSWGATLSLLYAQAFPDRVEALVLRGTFLATHEELDWFYGGGAARFFPDLWRQFILPIPEDEQHDLIAAYHKRLFCGNYGTEARYARAWATWENALASVDYDGVIGEAPTEYSRAFARLENHYFQNRCFIEEGQILRDRHMIEHIPATIVQGRFDMICPPTSSWRLAEGWARASLRMVPAAGHALSERGIAAALVLAMNRLRD